MEEIWKRILKYEGEWFVTVTGIPFCYTIINNILTIDTVKSYNLGYNNFKKAFEMGDLGQPTLYYGVAAKSYIYAILLDNRIGAWPGHDFQVDTNGFLSEDSDDLFSVTEGGRKLRAHKIIERNQRIVRKAKKEYLKKCPTLDCQLCEFSFVKTFEVQYIEAHHIVPLGEFEGIRNTNIDDFLMICSNCHIMLHRNPNINSIQDLKNLIKPKK